MGTTPNYAIPYPEITDFVTDGATAMENIAEKVDEVLVSVTNGRNRLINGDFRVAQRATSFVAGANNDDTYNLDRWYVLSEVNDTVDITQSSVAPTGGLFSIGLDVETSNNKFGIAQIIETRNLVGCVGSQCTLSFKFRTSGSSIGNVKAAIISWTGTADTVTSDFVSAWNTNDVNPTLIANAVYENTPINLNPTNSWQTASITALVDAAGTNNIAVFIWCDDKTTTLADFLYVTDVQFEVGSVATAFERKTFSEVFSECARYYFRYTAVGASNNIARLSPLGFQASTTSSAFICLPAVPMRASPTISGAGADVSDDTTYATVIFALTLGSSTGISWSFTATHAAVGAQFRPVLIRAALNNTAFIDFSIEL
jgi:hypothetical protein